VKIWIAVSIDLVASPTQLEIIDCTLAGLREFCEINKIYIIAAYIHSQMST
jgi:hypothetical protein